MKRVMFIDYNYCSGCHSCEVACQQVHGLEPSQFGIELVQIGPDQTGPHTWQLDNLPVPTDRCDRCSERQEQGKRPLCEQTCQSDVIRVCTLDEACVHAAKSDKYVIYG